MCPTKQNKTTKVTHIISYNKTTNVTKKLQQNKNQQYYKKNKNILFTYMKQKKKIYIKCLQKFRVYTKRKQKKLQIPNKDIYVYTYIDDSNTTINFLKT